MKIPVLVALETAHTVSISSPTEGQDIRCFRVTAGSSRNDKTTQLALKIKVTFQLNECNANVELVGISQTAWSCAQGPERNPPDPASLSDSIFKCLVAPEEKALIDAENVADTPSERVLSQNRGPLLVGRLRGSLHSPREIAAAAASCHVTVCHCITVLLWPAALKAASFASCRLSSQA